MDEITKSMTTAAIAVPGSLGIILAIATFAFMAWLVRFVLKTNAVREDKLYKLIELDLQTQKAQLDRIEVANTMQREEHRVLLSDQERVMNSCVNIAGMLERIAGMVTANAHKILN